MTKKLKDLLYWIAAVAIFLVMVASCIQIVNPVTGEGWNPIMWVIQIVFGAWLLLCAVGWLFYYLVYVPVRWIIRKIKPDPYADYPAWYRKHFIKK